MINMFKGHVVNKFKAFSQSYTVPAIYCSYEWTLLDRDLRCHY